MNSENKKIPHEEIEPKLWEYIDGFCSVQEKSAIEQLITENAEWRSKYQELLQVHEMIQSTELEQPSLRFTKNVMEEIAKFHIAPATKRYINNKIIYGIAAFFITIVIGFIIYAFSQVNWSQASDSKSTFGINLGNVDYSPMFNNTLMNVFMMLNVVLGLLLLDRYLSAKRKKILNTSH